MKPSSISIIIPALNEEKNLKQLLPYLKSLAGPDREIIVVDAMSSDESLEVCQQLGVNGLCSEQRCRAHQMNLGAKLAKGKLLYFVHADSRPPSTALVDISEAVEQGSNAGCFRFKFDSSNPLLKINSYFTRFNRLWCRGGDQTLFVTKQLFEQTGGFPTDHIIMEEYTYIKTLQAASNFKIIPKDVIVSDRKYRDNSWLRVQLANLIVFNMYRLGVSQERMYLTYRQLLKHR